MLHYRKIKLTEEENAKNKMTEKESKESLANSSSTPAEQSKDKGKAFIECPIETQPSSTIRFCKYQ